MKVLVFKSSVGSGCVVEPGALLTGVSVPDNRYVPAGSVITAQEDADRLPVITDDYPLRNLNKGVIHVNTNLAKGYLKAAGTIDG
jgi:carbonic anhydrase/acetyltransferase-like protein (isoleucine patch superfamily)